MTPEQKAAHVIAQAACLNAHVAAMEIANNMCFMKSSEPIYKEQDFMDLINRYGVHHNAVVTFFRD